MKATIKLSGFILFLTLSALCWAGGRNDYFSGDGGRGMSLAVLVPDARGLAADQNYLPTMVQGVLVGDLSKYSAISVLDRMRLESVLRETESGIYRSEADFGRLGEIANVDYVLTSSIVKTNTGYSLQMQIVGTGRDTIGITRASYSGNPTIAEFDNYTGIRRASMELLTQMGVNLTDSARQELSGAGTSAYVNAQTALAQGIVAQRSGNTVESMVRFYEANAYDPSFAEAATRANTMSATIRTGSLGQDIRNDIAWRDEWVKILDDTRRYLRSLPIIVVKIRYNPNLRQGTINYNARTVDLLLDVVVDVVPYPQTLEKMISDLNAGLRATGRQSQWRLSNIDLDQIFRSRASVRSRRSNADIDFSIEAFLINSFGERLSYNDVFFSIKFARNGGHGPYLNVAYPFDFVHRSGLTGRMTISFWGVSVNDLTDNITINLNASCLAGDTYLAQIESVPIR
jgi:TolB-like protein